MRKPAALLRAIFIFFFFADELCRAELVYQEIDDGATKAHVLANDFICATISPSRSGSVISLVDRLSQRELIRTAAATRGWLEDLDETARRYRVGHIAKTPFELSLTLEEETPNPQRMLKRYFLRDGHAALGCEITVKNMTTSELRPALQLAFPLSDIEMRVLWPTTSGTTAASLKELLTDTINDSPVDAWTAWLSPNGTGAALVTEYDTLQAFVLRKAAAGQSPLLELRSVGLPAGKSGTTSLWIVPLRGLESVSWAGKDMVATARLAQGKDALRLSWTGMLTSSPRWPLPVSVTMRAGDRTLRTHDFAFPAGWNPAATMQIVWYWTVPEKGGYSIVFNAGTSTERLAAWNVSIAEDGTVSTVSKRQNPKGFEVETLPDWKPEPVATGPIQPTLLQSVLNVLVPPVSGNLVRCEKIDAAVGVGECYSEWFALRSAVERASVKMEIALLKPTEETPSDKSPGLARIADSAVRLKIVETVEQQSADPESAPVLLEKKSFSLSAGETKLAALAIDSASLPVGVYTTAITISSKEEILAQIPVRIRVYPVRPSGGAAIFGVPQQSEMLSQEQERLKFYFNHVASHSCGGIVLPLDAVGSRHVVKIRGSNRTLSEAISGAPDFFSRPQLPGLDFSAMDDYTDTAIFSGLLDICVSVPLDGVVSVIGLPPGAVADSNRIMQWYWSELYRYLRDKGYREICVWLTGPLTMDNFQNAYRPALEVLSGIGWKPFATFTDIVPDPSALRILSGRQSVWQWDFTARTVPSTWLQQGLLAPAAGDSIGLWLNYSPSAAPWEARRDCWLALAGRKDFRKLWIPIRTRYHRPQFQDAQPSPAGASMMRDGGVVVVCPAWEAVRDGLNDLRYLSLLDNLSPDLQDSQGRDKDGVLRQVLAEALAPTDDKPLPLAARLGAARNTLLASLADFQAAMEKQKPTIRWQDLPILDAGTPAASIVVNFDNRTDRFQANSILSSIRALAGETSVSALSNMLCDESPFAPAEKVRTVIVIGKPAKSPLLDALLALTDGPTFSDVYPGRERYVIRRLSWDGQSGPLAERLGRVGRPLDFILLAAPDDRGVANAAQNFKMRLVSTRDWIVQGQ